MKGEGSGMTRIIIKEDLNRWVGSKVRVCTTDAFEDPGEHENGRSVVDFYAEANT